MISLFSRKRPLADCLRGACDYHSHLLPGVDDGIQTLSDSLSLLQLMEQAGVRKVWCTPHIMEDYPNTTASLRQRFTELQAAYTGPVELGLAAEYMLDTLFEQRLAGRDLLPIGEQGDQLLVETSYYTPPIGFKRQLQAIQSAGYYPLLAHPERYQYMSRTDYEELHALQVRFQLNLASLIGLYGKPAQQKAEWLLKKGYYHQIGADTHSVHFYRNLLEAKLVNPKLLQDILSIL